MKINDTMKYKIIIFKVVEPMNTAKELIHKMVDEIPETKAGEVIDFLLFIKNKKEESLYMDEEEESEIWDLIKNDERVSEEKVKKILFEEE